MALNRDPKGLLEEVAEQFMRHVKLRPGCTVNAALRKLIDDAYTDMRKPEPGRSAKRCAS